MNVQIGQVSAGTYGEAIPGLARVLDGSRVVDIGVLSPTLPGHVSCGHHKQPLFERKVRAPADALM